MRNFLRGTLIIFYRDLLRFWRNKTRLITGFTFPILWLLIFGNGISSSLSLPVPNIKFVQFLFPGVIAQYLVFTAGFSAISILQDREFGFLKEILVSPVDRTAIAIGKMLGGAVTAVLMALPIILLGPTIGVELNFKMIAILVPAMFLLALSLSALGVAITTRMKSLDAGQYIFQFINFPIIMLSGAVFPLRNLPQWLDIATKVNPISYAVDLVRRVVFENSQIPSQAINALSPTINGHVVGTGWEIAIVAGFTIIMLFLGSQAFREN